MTERATGGDPSAQAASSGRAHDGAGAPASPRSRADDPRAPTAKGADACEIWGVLNVTPDSFSDGGDFIAVDAALAHAARLLREGAHVIDVGGESSRPPGTTYGAPPLVSESEELRRVIPVIEGLRALGARVSVDTVKARVAERAVRAGATIINDVSCGRSEALLAVAAASGCELVLMHNRGRGERSAANVKYTDVVREVRDELMAAVDRAITHGCAPERIWIDPGLGFAKTGAQSATLCAHTDVLVATGQRVLMGPSRKSFIGEIAPLGTGEAPGPQQRLGGTAAAVVVSVLQGAHAVRVHDVLAMRQACLVAGFMRESRP